MEEKMKGLILILGMLILASCGNHNRIKSDNNSVAEPDSTAVAEGFICWEEDHEILCENNLTFCSIYKGQLECINK
jgi:hypothetical protein